MDGPCHHRALKPGLIALALTVIVVAAATAMLYAGAVDGRFGFLFFLLIVVSPVFIAGGAAICVWRLISSMPERLLFTAATFIVVCGAGPLALSTAVISLGRGNAPIGAAGMWALLAILIGVWLCFASVVSILMRYWKHRSGGNVQSSG